MSVIKYVGRTTSFKGKTLWEIVGNLKGGGIGRIVVRSRFERYPEPSFMKILRIEPLPFEKPRKVKVWVEKTFRGRMLPKVILINSVSYKADYRLLPKDEEEEYCKITKAIEEKAVPKLMEFPPLLKDFVLKEYEKKGLDVSDDIYLNINYKKSLNSLYKPVEGENLKPYPMKLGDTSSKMYSDIKFD